MCVCVCARVYVHVCVCVCAFLQFLGLALLFWVFSDQNFATGVISNQVHCKRVR